MKEEKENEGKVQREVVLPIESVSKEVPQGETKIEIKRESEEKPKEKPKEEPKRVYKKDFVKDLGAIFILGRGHSLGYCPVKIPPNVEYWGCNNTYKARETDRLFIMHDIYMTQFNRKTEIIKEANEKGFPVYTLGKYKELENNIQYPMQEVINYFKKIDGQPNVYQTEALGYFLTTASYMLALAIMQKPKNIVLFGVDMDFGTASEYMQNEKSCLEYWLGQAIGRRIPFKLAPGSTLMKRKGRENYYGFKETKDAPYNMLRLDPVLEWNKPKSALRYKIVKVSHNL